MIRAAPTEAGAAATSADAMVAGDIPSEEKLLGIMARKLAVSGR